MNVFLIGYRGSGKTTVARRLAELLGWTFIDADAELESRAGKSIKEIFAAGGEPAFRELESRVITDLAERKEHVVALGGGAILREANRKAIAGRGPVVWLQASPETLFARINADPTTADRRPNLTAEGGVVEIRKLLDERTPQYKKAADLAVDCNRLDPDEIARQILASLSQRKLL
jgi:shikimate kinase